jgi:hypothetical protein
MATKKRTKTTEITVERSDVFVVRRTKETAGVWCERCGERVRMVTPEEAARTTGASTRAIYRRVETGRMHFIETAEGLLLVCLTSIKAEIK